MYKCAPGFLPPSPPLLFFRPSPTLVIFIPIGPNMPKITIELLFLLKRKPVQIPGFGQPWVTLICAIPAKKY